MPRFRISQFMILTAIAAILLAIVTRPSQAVLLVLILIALAALAPFALTFLPNSLEYVLRNPPSGLDEHIAALERALISRSLLKIGPLSTARFKLMQLHKRRKSYETAIAHAREVLARYWNTHSFQSQIHLEIAECLDSLGRDDESKAEIRLAADCLDLPPADALGWLIQGRIFAAKDRHELAIDAYERALKLPSFERQKIRRESQFLLTVACLRVGRLREAIDWADSSMKHEESSSRVSSLSRLAALACSRLGRLSEQENYLRRAHELAVQANDKKEIADSLAMLAELERSQGNLTKAEAICLEAESLAPEMAREAFLIHSHVCRNQGRTEEAVEKLTQAGKVAVLQISSAERRVQAIFKLNIATYRVDLGQIEQASDDLRQAQLELERDPRLVAIGDAVNLRLIAIQGARADTVSRSEELLHRLDGRSLGIPGRSQCLVLIGRALMDVGEHTRAIQCFDGVVAETSHRINQPVGHYYRGECRRQLGDLPNALEDFTRATSFGVDSHHARLAEQRLRELRSPQALAAQHDDRDR
jgi:tetratricopeptide (TPR) repeat protein